MKKLEKHCDEIYKNGDWVYICEYDLSEIGDKINEIIEVLNHE